MSQSPDEELRDETVSQDVLAQDFVGDDGDADTDPPVDDDTMDRLDEPT